jgi:hypothetical protein
VSINNNAVATGWVFGKFLFSFRRFVEKVQQLLIFEKNNRHFTKKPIKIYDKISPKKIYNNTIYRQLFRSVGEHKF